MKTVHALEYSRNFGFWSEAEQEALIASRVAIAGVGGVGYQVGSKLARMGVSSFAIADPEDFEPQNANRVPGASTLTYGRSKAEVFRDEVKAINPDAVVHIYRDGVTVQNAAEFVAGATLVFDESETTHPEIGTTIAREARALGIPNLLVVNVGFSATVTAFHPQSRFTFERFMGLPEGASLEEIAASAVDYSRFLPYVPPYSDLRGLVAMTSDGPDGTRPSLPSISPGVDLASALGTTQAFLHLTAAAGIVNRRRKPIWAPRVAYLDAYTLRARVLRASRPTHWRHVLRAAAADRLRGNPRAAYTHADIARRSAP
jgi:molybdopterin/thiamine biosynthesis adenylyltransferase